MDIHDLHVIDMQAPHFILKHEQRRQLHLLRNALQGRRKHNQTVQNIYNLAVKYIVHSIIPIEFNCRVLLRPPELIQNDYIRTVDAYERSASLLKAMARVTTNMVDLYNLFVSFISIYWKLTRKYEANQKRNKHSCHDNFLFKKGKVALRPKVVFSKNYGNNMLIHASKNRSTGQLTVTLNVSDYPTVLIFEAHELPSKFSLDAEIESFIFSVAALHINFPK